MFKELNDFVFVFMTIDMLIYVEIVFIVCKRNFCCFFNIFLIVYLQKGK